MLLVLLLLLLLLRLLRCVSFLCWGSELWLQGLGGLSATVRLDVAGAGARPSSACLSFEGRPRAVLTLHPGV